MLPRNTESAAWTKTTPLSTPHEATFVKTINREVFLKKLEAVQPGLAKKENLIQSGSVVLKDGAFHTLSEEIYCCAPSGFDPAWEAALPAKPLLGILKKLKGEEFTVSLDDGELLFKGDGTTGVRIESEVHLPIDLVDKPSMWKPLPRDFTVALGMVWQCASSKLDEWVKTYIHIHPEWVEAWDGFQMARFSLKTTFSQPTLLRKEGVKHLCNLSPTNFCETENWVHFQSDVSTISCRRYLDDYPELEKFLAVTGEKVTLPKEIAGEIEKAEEFSKENRDDNVVKVTLSKGEVRVKGTGETGWFRSNPVKLPYKGKPFSFLIPPALLREIVTKYEECIISPDRILVGGGDFAYISAISQE